MILIEQKVVRTKKRSYKGGKEMLKGENLTYIRHDRMRGVGNKSGQPYDFANITFSDGLESFKVDVRPEITESSFVQSLRKGDKVNIHVDIYENFNKTAFIVADIKPAIVSKVG